MKHFASHIMTCSSFGFGRMTKVSDNDQVHALRVLVISSSEFNGYVISMLIQCYITPVPKTKPMGR